MPPFDAREEADCTPRFGWQDDPRLSDAEKADAARLGRRWARARAGASRSRRRRASICRSSRKTLTPATPWFREWRSRSVHLLPCSIPATTPAGDVDERPAGAARATPGRPPRRGDRARSPTRPRPRSSPRTASASRGTAASSRRPRPRSSSASGRPATSRWRRPPTSRCRCSRTSKIVMQIHYHPAGVTNLPDTTAIDLRTSTDVAAEDVLRRRDRQRDRRRRSCCPIPTTARRPRPSSASRATRRPHEHMRLTIANLGNLTGVKALLGQPAHAPRRHAHQRQDRARRGDAAPTRRTSASRTATGTSTGSARTSTTRRSITCRRSRSATRSTISALEQHDRQPVRAARARATGPRRRRSTSRSARAARPTRCASRSSASPSMRRRSRSRTSRS